MRTILTAFLLLLLAVPLGAQAVNDASLAETVDTDVPQVLVNETEAPTVVVESAKPYVGTDVPKDVAFEFAVQVLAVGMAAVFMGLMAVFLFMVFLKKVNEPRKAKSGEDDEMVIDAPEVSTEVAHAIALALFMDLRVFDEEEEAHEIMIKKVTRPFSPWWNSGRLQSMQDKIDIFRRPL